MNGLFLSIIIPVYNAEKYIAECLDSCLNQNILLSDYEIICVNDGSKDSSLDILKKYASQNTNIKLIDQENGGVSAARNAGLSYANGEYIWFVDADDLICPNILNKLRETVRTSNCDRFTFHNIYVFSEKLSAEEIEKLGQETLSFNNSYGDGVVCTSFFRRSYLNEHLIQFRKGVAYGEDLLFMYEFNRFPNVIASTSELIYLQRLNSASAVANAVSRRNVDSDYRGAVIMKEYFESEGKAGIASQNTCYIYCHFVRCAMHTLARAPFKTFWREIIRFYRAGLWPVKLPRSRKPYPVNMSERKDWFGKLYNRMYERPYTFHGAIMLRIFVQTMDLAKSRLRKRK